jgi:hypothetical protein
MRSPPILFPEIIRHGRAMERLTATFDIIESGMGTERTQDEMRFSY